MAALSWFLLALGLLSLGWLGIDGDGLLPALLAALGMSLLLAVTPTLAISSQLAVFAGLMFLLLPVLQRWSRRRRTRAIPPGGSSEHASVISGFDPVGTGRVRWQGQSWGAINLEPQQRLQPGDAVLVMGREGNRLQVLAAAAER